MVPQVHFLGSCFSPALGGALFSSFLHELVFFTASGAISDALEFPWAQAPLQSAMKGEEDNKLPTGATGWQGQSSQPLP